jgi:hypothetical protein
VKYQGYKLLDDLKGVGIATHCIFKINKDRKAEVSEME